MTRKGIVLAGGKGTRLGELTRAVNKHLLPVGSWPMVCYPIEKLTGAGVRDILLVSGPESIGEFARLLGSGRERGCSLFYRAQDEPGGIAQALALAESFCRGEPCVVLLGDNVFQTSLQPILAHADAHIDHALIALHLVDDPRAFGVAELAGGRIVSIEEKPLEPRGPHAVTGIYVFPADVFDRMRGQQPSARGELEITDVLRGYLREDRLDHVFLDGYWTDAGTPESLRLANKLVAAEFPRFTD